MPSLSFEVIPMTFGGIGVFLTGCSAKLITFNVSTLPSESVGVILKIETLRHAIALTE